MEKHKYVNAKSYQKDFIINLNSENMPAVGGLDEKSYVRFLDYSDYFKLIKYNNQFIGFIIALLPGRPYKSVNYALGITGEDMASGDFFTVSNKTVNGFDVLFKNSSGTNISRTFDFIAKGF